MNLKRLTENEESIDAVITWVDGGDASFREQLDRFMPWMPWLRPGRNRYRDNGELRFSLRSIYFNMPWLRRINIVTNGQVPPWLDRNHPKIRLIAHGDYFASPDHLPTFSSLAIEANLPWISRAGVARRFLLFNDDTFVARPVPRDYFVTDNGAQRFRCLPEALPRPKLVADSHYHLLVFNGALLSRTFGRKPWSYPPHMPVIFDQDDLAWLMGKFGFWLRRTSRHRFRHRSDAFLALLYVHALTERDAGRMDGARRLPLAPGEISYLPFTERTDMVADLVRWLIAPPTFFCVNDEIDDDTVALAHAADLNMALAGIFPTPTPFELDMRDEGEHRCQDYLCLFGPGCRLLPGASIYSPRRRFRLTFRTADRRIILQANESADATPQPAAAAHQWRTLTSFDRLFAVHGMAGAEASSLTMKGDGNLELGGDGILLWSSATAGNAGAYMAVQDDGRIILYRRNGDVLLSGEKAAGADPT